MGIKAFIKVTQRLAELGMSGKYSEGSIPLVGPSSVI
jgi:hypothetical protein